MIHGGLAYIDTQRLRLSEDLIRPLSIAKGSTVFGLYYPPPSRKGYENVPVRHDFMFTPVPYESWPVSAALMLHIEHEPGSYAFISEYLAKRRINIITAQCTRSGHRHATWYLIVEFLWLRDENLSVHKLDLLAEQLCEQIDEVVEDLQKECFSVLMKQDSPYLRQPVSGWALQALAYFYKETKGPEIGRHRLLQALCQDRSTLELQWSTGLEQYPKLFAELPTLGFASLDTQAFNLRVAVPDRSALERFRTVSVDFAVEKKDWQDSSLGLMSDLAGALSKDWNLWRVYNQTLVNTRERETGRVRLFMQRLTESVVDDDSEEDGNEENALRKLVLETIASSGSYTVENFRTGSISPRNIFVSLKNSDDFSGRKKVLQYCSELAAEIGVLNDYVFSVETFAADSLVAEASTRIADCSGMLQLYMADKEDADTTWLNSEFFLAAHLKKPCVRIVAESMSHKVAFLRDRQPIEIADDPSDEVLRNTIRKALHELGEFMEARSRGR